MPQSRESIIRNAYGEAVLAAKEKGLSGPTAVKAAVRAAAKVATRVLGTPVNDDEVERVVHG